MNALNYEKMEKRIRELEELLEEIEKNNLIIQETANLGSWNLDLVNNELKWSDKNYEIFGITDKKIENTYENFLKIVHPDDIEFVNEKWMAAVNNNEPYDIKHRLLINGKIRWVREAAKIIRDREGRPLRGIGITQDITEAKLVEAKQKKLQEQLIHSQKMESIGRLAGGIAHDFNNLLTSISGFAEILSLKYPDTSTEEGDAAETILQNTERASELTQQLLGFAREGKYNPQPVNLNSLITETMDVSKHIFAKKVEIIKELQKDIKNIEVDKNQIQLVITNLIINANDAMPEGGTIKITTENTKIVRDYSNDQFFYNKGEYIKLMIEDSGEGIPGDRLIKIFDPFYTTKEKSKGTGLGLSTVYGIIKNHQGYINVDSEINTGTVFTILLPVSHKTPEKKQISAIPVIQKHKKTILVVDDEYSVIKCTEKMLNILGYEVILAHCGKNALEIYKEQKNEIDLVLLDLIMPGMDGRETNLELQKFDPDIKVILLSGYSQSGKISKIIEEGAIDFIQKPFRMNIMVETLNKVFSNKTLKQLSR